MTDRHAAYPTGLRDAPTRHRALRQRMAAPGIVVAPGAYDCITARLVEVSGFDALYVTGSGVSMSALGAPDMGALSFGEILDRVASGGESFVDVGVAAWRPPHTQTGPGAAAFRG